MAICGTLTFQNGAQFGHEINITAVTRDKPALVIGSDTRAHLRVDDPAVGRSHATIMQIEGEYRIKPTLPLMQVFVNDQQIERAQLLHPGDVIRIGETEISFNIDERVLAEIKLPSELIKSQLKAAEAQYVYYPGAPQLAPAGVSPAQAQIYRPQSHHQSSATGINPATLLVGLASILSIVSVLAYTMVVSGGFSFGPTPLVYSDDAVTFVMFEASWCQYCKQQKPIVRALEQEYDGMMRVRYIDIDSSANRQLVAEYRATSVPLMLVLDQRGRVIATYRGLTKAQTLMDGIDKALKV